MEEGERVEVYEFERNPTEKVIVSLSVFKGRTLADLRTYYESEDGEWRPTKKGISVPAEKLPDLKEAVDKLISLAQN
jgi:hypothetical protein